MILLLPDKFTTLPFVVIKAACLATLVDTSGVFLNSTKTQSTIFDGTEVTISLPE